MVVDGAIIKTVVLGFIIRLILIMIFSNYQNIQQHAIVFTDIDYKVYSDATLYETPYDRHTYRYSPIISYLMSYNYTSHETIGKIIFAIFDCIAMIFLYKILKRYNSEAQKKYSQRSAKIITKIYAFNPLFIYLTARGSCQSITLAFMYAFWYYYFGGSASGNHSFLRLKTQKIDNLQPQKWKRLLSYAIYGVWVHLRVYPIVLLPLILMHEYYAYGKSMTVLIKQIVQIGLISGGVFIFLAFVFYLKYGYSFLQNTYFYHLYRKDNRHSFSPYFYEIYLGYEYSSVSKSFIRNIPFLYILMSLSSRQIKVYSLFCLHFLVTFAFVTFNSVITLQYYMWVIGSLLLLLPQSILFIKERYRMAIGLSLQYFFPILIWIWLSIRLQGNGQNYLHTMWMITLFQVFFQLWVLLSFIETVKIYNPYEQKKQKLQAAKKMLVGGKKN